MMTIADEKTPKIERRTLGGATLLLIQDKSLPLVRWMVMSRQGSMADPKGKSGLASIMWEMLLRGTQQKSRRDFNTAVERLGSQVDVFSGVEFAGIQGHSLTRHLDATMALMAEALCAPQFAGSELKSLVQESQDRLHSERDDDDTVASYFLRQALYPNHSLGRWGRGAADELASLNVNDLQTLHRTVLQPSELVFAAAGDIDWRHFEAHVQALLAAFPAAMGQQTSLPETPRPQGTRIILVDKPERSQAQLRLATLGVPGSHPDLLALYLATVSFGGTFTAPFSREVRDVRGWSYVASVEMPRRRRFDAPWVAYSAPASKDAVDCLALELELFGRFAAFDFPKEDVEQARQYLLNRFPFEIASASDMLMPAVLVELLGRPQSDIFSFPEWLQAVSAASLPAVVGRHFFGGDAVVVVVATARDIEADLRGRFPQASLQVVDYQAKHLGET